MRAFILQIAAILLISCPSCFGAAGCFLWKDNSVLMVRDVWSKRWSLPGGGALPNESLEQTALRELKEETGVDARILGGGAELNNGFTVFACEPVGGITGFPTANGFRLRVPKNAVAEILEIRFVEIEKKKPETFRFSAQREPLLLLLDRFSSVYQGSITELRTYQYREGDSPLSIRVVERVQDLLSGWGWTYIFRLFSFLGDEPFFFLVLPFLFVFWSREKALPLGLLIVASGAVSSVLKNLFTCYRPFEFVPALQSGSAFDFSFPSGHAIISSSVWIFWAGTQRRWKRAIALLVVFMTSLSRIHLGVHFLEDVLAGAAIGSTMALIALRWLHRPIHRLKGRGLHLFGLALVIACLITFNPTTVAALSAFIGLFLFVTLERSFKVPLRKLTVALIGVAGFFIFSKAFDWVGITCSEFTACLLLRFIKYGLLGAWLGFLYRVRPA